MEQLYSTYKDSSKLISAENRNHRNRADHRDATPTDTVRILSERISLLHSLFDTHRHWKHLSIAETLSQEIPSAKTKSSFKRKRTAADNTFL